MPPPPTENDRPLPANNARGLPVNGEQPVSVRAEASTRDQEPSLFPGQEVDSDAAKAWVRHQFADMSVLLEHVVKRLDTFSRARALVPADVSGLLLNNTGHRFRQGVSGELAREFLSAMYLMGARTLIVEDELASKGDPLEDVFYVGGAVLRSVSIKEDAASAVRLLRYRLRGLSV